MPLESGVQIGRYRIVARLGGGGMGEVYRARDVTLERDVALKIITADAASDLVQRQTDRLRLPDESKPTERLRRVHTEPSACTLGRRQKAQPLVVPKRVRRDAATRGQLPDLEGRPRLRIVHVDDRQLR